jgi:hypothetical protein
MQHKPDNEWDNLFKNKFDNAEITPSASVWKNIEAELSTKKRRILPIYWWVAASMVVVTTTLLVFTKTNKTDFNGVKHTSTIASKNKSSKPSSKTDALFTVKPDDKKQAVKIWVSAKIINAKIDKNKIGKTFKNNKLAEKEAIASNLQIAYNPTKKVEINATDTLLIANILPPQQATAIAQTDTASINKNTITQTKIPQKGIRNIGELVNFLVSKVDKREKKLIKFNTDAGGNSSIAAINIGIIQLNSKKSYNN